MSFVVLIIVVNALGCALCVRLHRSAYQRGFETAKALYYREGGR